MLEGFICVPGDQVQGGGGLGAQQASGDRGHRGGAASCRRDPHQGERLPPLRHGVLQFTIFNESSG